MQLLSVNCFAVPASLSTLDCYLTAMVQAPSLTLRQHKHCHCGLLHGPHCPAIPGTSPSWPSWRMMRRAKRMTQPGPAACPSQSRSTPARSGVKHSIKGRLDALCGAKPVGA